jgi:hypothetical protein
MAGLALLFDVLTRHVGECIRLAWAVIRGASSETSVVSASALHALLTEGCWEGKCMGRREVVHFCRSSARK